MSTTRLVALAALAGLVRDRDLARLGAAAGASRALRDQIARIEAEIASRAAAVGHLPQDDAALRAGADQKWLELLDRRRIAIRQELARAMARQEAAKAEALRALGRAAALERLSDRGR